ncbi:tlde1 domain-containing protein [Haliangium sp. UPWRP_2]|uniref:tlde1 domain-containing protein n=1 Tax=Haliangium sp. UPWRP_2 TaxID=1931276 RepID=UPI000B53EE37|nr:DUF2778 domain-containing protein [Haliangium sp. UPWRP_2]
MPWTYHQSTGQLYHNGTLVGTGYSGSGNTTSSGRNNPAMQQMHNQGPIPQGTWQIGTAYQHAQKGPTSMNLTNTSGNTFGRSAFMIHGNNAQNNASQGCIILPPTVRQQIANSTDKTLIVVP